MHQTMIEAINFSEGITGLAEIKNYLLGIFPSALRIEKAETRDDKNGTDYWVHRESPLDSLSIDFKHRSFCPISKWGSDDACIELVSVYAGKLDMKRHFKRSLIDNRFCKRLGWSVNRRKTTDFIVYTWPSKIGLRYWIVSFPILCAASIRFANEWIDRCGFLPTHEHRNNNYLTLNVFPSRQQIRSAMERIECGEVDCFSGDWNASKPIELAPDPEVQELNRSVVSQKGFFDDAL